MRIHRRTLFVGLLGVLFLSACSLLGGEDSKRAELEEYRRIWEEQGFSRYRYTLSVVCYCSTWPYPARIKVRADTVAAVLDPETGDTLRHPDTGRPAHQEMPDSYQTVEGLFGVVERALDEDYHYLSVQYNDRYGYPTKIDYEVDENMTDDEVLYEVRAFEPQ